MLDNQGKAHENPVNQKLEEPDDYDAVKQIVEEEEVDKMPGNKMAENIGICALICLFFQVYLRTAECP